MADKVLARDASVAEAVAVADPGSTTDTFGDLVDQVVISDVGADPTFSVVEYLALTDPAVVQHQIPFDSKVSDKISNILAAESDLVDGDRDPNVHAEDVHTLDQIVNIATSGDNVIDTWHAKDAIVSDVAVLDADLADDLKDISVEDLFNLGYSPADNQSLLLGAVTVEDEFGVIQNSLIDMRAGIYGQLQSDSVHAIDAVLTDAVDLAGSGNQARWPFH